MKTKLSAPLAIIMVLCVVWIAGCAPAAHVGDADGVWCYLPRKGEADIIKTVGRNAIYAMADDGDWTGTITGSSEDYGTVMIRSSGQRLYIGVISFASVDVGGRSGGLEMHVIGELQDTGSDWKGTWAITDGTGDLEGTTGRGSWWGTGWQSDYEECGVLHYSVEELDHDTASGDD